MADANEAFRQTLDTLIEKRAWHAAEIRKLSQAIEAVLTLLPEEERYPYLNALAAGAEDSRFPPDTTLSEAAEMVLRHFGEPMRAGPIVKVLRQWGYPYEKDDTAMQASVGGILARKAGRGEVFTKIEAGLFGLIGWEQQEDQPDAEYDAETGEGVTPIDRAQASPIRAVAGSNPTTQAPTKSGYEDFQTPSFGDEEDDLPF